jgi:hypothetical protein
MEMDLINGLMATGLKVIGEMEVLLLAKESYLMIMEIRAKESLLMAKSHREYINGATEIGLMDPFKTG